VAHRQDEVGPHEEVDLSELHLLQVVDVTRRTQHDEQRAAVPLQLGTLVRAHRVLDRQLVQVEFRCQGGDLGLVRPVEPDPGHRMLGLAERQVGVGE